MANEAAIEAVANILKADDWFHSYDWRMYAGTAKKVLAAFEQTDEQKQKQRDAARWNDYVEFYCLGNDHTFNGSWIYESTKAEIGEAFDTERATLRNRATLADPT